MYRGEERMERGERPEERPEEEWEVEDSFLEKLRFEEEAVGEEDAESLIRDTSLALKRLEEGGIQLLWSSLEPREEFLWRRMGNTIRLIILKGWHYSEHLELGVCELGEDAGSSLEALKKRTFLKTKYMSAFKPDVANTQRSRFLESQGGREKWWENLTAVLSEIVSGAVPERLVLALPDAMLKRSLSPFVWEIGQEKLRLSFIDNTLILESRLGIIPFSAWIELAEGLIRGEKGESYANAWSFTLPPGLTWEETVFRPLIIECTELEDIGPAVKHLWPSVSVVELMEAIAKKGLRWN